MARMARLAGSRSRLHLNRWALVLALASGTWQVLLNTTFCLPQFWQRHLHLAAQTSALGAEEAAALCAGAVDHNGRKLRTGCNMYGGGGPFGRGPGGMPGGMPGGPGMRPGGGMPGGYPGGGMPGQPGGGGGWPDIDLSTIFLVLLVLSFIPGPWQVVTGPLLNILNIYYLFKFGIFFLAIVVIGGGLWWVNASTIEGQCPSCGFPQRGMKSEPFNCINCGAELEVKNERFEKYMKSGQVKNSPFEDFADFVRDTAQREPAASSSASSSSRSSGSSSRSSSSSRKPGGSKPDVIDAEVL